MSENMNEAQRLAAAHGEGPMLVLAGPGSGKTFTITRRIFRLTQQHIPPDRILVITFTREAAQSMQKRYREQYGASPVCFGTFHSVFYHILKESRAGAREQLLKPSDKKDILLPLIQKYKIDHDRSGSTQELPSELADVMDRILAAFSYFKNTLNMEKAAACLEEPWREAFQTLFDGYESVRRRKGGLDFDDMVYDCMKLFQGRADILALWRRRFSFFLIDEFQDINPVQYQTVRLLAAPLDNVFAVGDDDQSIYAFRGSDPSLMRRFSEDYPGAKQVLLDINYRSTAPVVEASLKVISQNTQRFEKTLKAAEAVEHPDKSENRVKSENRAFRDKNGIAEAEGIQNAVRLAGFTDKNAQYAYLAERLKEEQALGGLSDCAVLFRTNGGMREFAGRLLKAGIPYRMKEAQTCIYDHFVAKDIEAYLRMALGERDRSLFLQVMNKPDRGLNREAFTAKSISLQEYGRAQASGPAEALQRLERDLVCLGKRKPSLGMQFLRRGIGYEAYLMKKARGEEEKQREWLEVLEWLTEDAAGHESLEEWLESWQEFREKWKKNGERKNGGDDWKPAVSLMTAHASKGLEYSKVFLPDVNEGVYPHGRGPLEQETVEEECRILYVAMTRAKKALELLCVTGTQERPALPSRFLRALQEPDHSAESESSTSSSNSQVSRYSSKASATFSYSSSSAMKPSSGSSLGSSGFSV